MDREKLKDIQEKLAKYVEVLKYLSFIILTFLFFQINLFSVDVISKSLIIKASLLAGILQIIIFLLFLGIEEKNIFNVVCSLNKYIVKDLKMTLKMALCPILLFLSMEFWKISSEMLPKESNEIKSYYIISVTVFSLLITRRKFFFTQLLAVMLITFGLLNINSNLTLSSSKITGNGIIYGYFFSFAAISSYGLCFSLLEMNLKQNDRDVSLWIRGIQFNVPYCILLLISNSFTNQRGQFFDDFNLISYFFVIFLAACNLLELFVIKVADSVFRMISMSLATMLLALMQNVSSVSSSIKLGSTLILIGTMIYLTIDLVTNTKIAFTKKEIPQDSHLLTYRKRSEDVKEITKM